MHGNWYMDIDKHLIVWQFFMFSLFVPWILVVLMILAVICLIKRLYWTAGMLVLVLCLANWYWQVFALGFNKLNDKKQECNIRVMTWNVDSTNPNFFNNADCLAKAILESDVDILFLTEYGKEDKGLVDSLLMKRFLYRLRFVENQSAFYSSFLVDTIYHIQTSMVENSLLFCCKLKKDEKSWTVIGCHLASNNHIINADSVQDRETLGIYLDNYSKQTKVHLKEFIEMARHFSDERCIVMGDMNDVAGSPVLRAFGMIDMKDAWWYGGFGYGATIHKPLPYRIDHMLYSTDITLNGIKIVKKNGLSDHDGLIADFSCK